MDGTALPIIVTVCGYQMSGAEWVDSMVQFIVHESDVTRSPNDPRRVVRCVHCKPIECDPDVFDPRSKLIIVFRHPKDTAAALYEQGGYRAQCGFSEFLSHFIGKNGAGNLSWVDFIVQWERALESRGHNRVHILYFNDLVRDLGKEVKNLCSFLEVPHSVRLIEQVVSTFDLDNFSSRNEPQRKRRKLGHSVARSDINIYEVGLWKHFFTVHQSDDFDQALNVSLGEHTALWDMKRMT